jgi:hypothetical protein
MKVYLPIAPPPKKLKRMEEIVGIPDSGPSSRGSTYWRRVLSCPREHFLANVLGWTEEHRTEALEVGLAWHYVLENLYRDIQKLQRGQHLPESPEKRAFELLRPFVEELTWSEVSPKLTEMLEVYLQRWYQRDLKTFEVLEVEATYQIPLDDGLGFEWSNRLDVVGIDHFSGTPVLRNKEHKSTYRVSEETMSGFQMDQQVLGQAFLMSYYADHPAAISPAYEGVEVNMVERPYSVSARSKAPVVERFIVHPTDAAYAAWMESMKFFQRLLVTYEVMDQYPRNYAQCTRKYGKCPFFGLCQSRPQDSVQSLRELDQAAREGSAALPPGIRRATYNDSREV